VDPVLLDAADTSLFIEGHTGFKYCKIALFYKENMADSSLFFLKVQRIKILMDMTDSFLL
jgi:hypothetical protein